MEIRSNIGKLDASIRYIVGALLLAVLVFVEGPWSLIGLLGFVLIATAAINWCPLWKLFGIDTREGHGHGPTPHVH